MDLLGGLLSLLGRRPHESPRPELKPITTPTPTPAKKMPYLDPTTGQPMDQGFRFDASGNYSGGGGADAGIFNGDSQFGSGLGVGPANSLATNQRLWWGDSPIQVGYNPVDQDMQPGGRFLQNTRPVQRMGTNVSNPLQGDALHGPVQMENNINQQPSLRDLLRLRY